MQLTRRRLRNTFKGHKPRVAVPNYPVNTAPPGVKTAPGARLVKRHATQEPREFRPFVFADLKLLLIQHRGRFAA